MLPPGSETRQSMHTAAASITCLPDSKRSYFIQSWVCKACSRPPAVRFDVISGSRIFPSKGKKASGALASLQSAGAQRTGSQEQVQHQNAKSTKYRDQQLANCSQREQQCDQRPLYVSPHRGPQPLATPEGLQPLPGGWNNRDTLTPDT